MEFTILEISGALFGAVAVFLTVRQNVFCWPVGMVNVSLYFVIFYRKEAFANTGLQVIYFAISAYGWYQWQHGGAQGTALRVTRISRKQGALVALFGAVGLLVCVKFLSFGTVDTLTTVLSLCAQWMMAKKLFECWWVWIAADVIYVPWLIDQGLRPTAGLYALFLCLAIMGTIEWRKSLKKKAAKPA